MAAAQDVRKNLNLYVDGRGYAGQIEDFNAPKLTLTTEEFRGGGTNAPIDITTGHEKPTADFQLIQYSKDVLALWGVTEGQSVPLVAREALESFDGTVTTVIHTMRGKILEIDPQTSQAGTTPRMKVTMSLTYYKLQHGDTTVHEIDVENYIQVINGTDALAAMASALGIR